MAIGHFARIVIAISAAVLLQGCAEGTGPFGKSPTADGDAAAGSTTIVERDVEAPEIFQTEGEGLWDGRPSLGGVWVAAPEVKDPERVIIRNEANGKFVIGALFRRERENPGPKLQVSSDAASALGMLAGAPAKLTVTALKREEVAPPPEPAPVDDRPAADAIAPADAISSEPLDPVIAAASAAIDKTPPPASPAPAPAPAPAASKLDKPYVQIGIFSVESNATKTAATLKTGGMPALVRKSSASGKDYWRVIVGPSQTAAERAEVLAKVKALGFTDSYLVSG